MKLSTPISIAFATALVASAQAASAQEASYLEKPMKAPSNAVELTVNAGYTQGFGRIAGGTGRSVDDVASAGVGFGLGVGYRFTPNWQLGIGGEYDQYSTGSKPSNGGIAMDSNSAARGLVSGVHVAYHLQPYKALDPWIQAMTGYRFLWEAHASPAPTILYHGFEWLRLTAGADIRTSEDVALAPFIGADLNSFLWVDNGTSAVAIGDTRLNMFIFAGLQGRFDVGGARQGSPTFVAAR